MHAAFEACPAELCIPDPAEEKMCILNKQISFFFHFRAFSKHRHIEQSIKKKQNILYHHEKIFRHRKKFNQHQITQLSQKS